MSQEVNLLGIANGDVALAEIRENGIAFSQVIPTLGEARAIEPAGDGEHLYVADGENGLVVIRYEGPQ